MSLPNHLLYPPNYDRNQEIPMKDFHFMKSLQIEDMVVLIKESHRGLMDLKLENYLTTNEEILSYRLEIVSDLVNNPSLYETFKNGSTLWQFKKCYHRYQFR